MQENTKPTTDFEPLTWADLTKAMNKIRLIVHTPNPRPTYFQSYGAPVRGYRVPMIWGLDED